MKGRDVVFYSLGQVLQQITTFGTSILVARTLGPSGYGLLSLVRNLYSTILIVAPLGLDTALMRHIPQSEVLSESLARVRLLRIVAFVLNMVVLVLAIPVGAVLESHAFAHPRFGLYLVVALTALPFAADANILTAVFRARHRPAPQVLVTLYLQPIVRASVTVGSILFGFGVTGVLLSTTVGSIVSALALTFVLNRWGPPPAPLRRSDIWAALRLLKYSSWIAVMLLSYGALRSIDVLILGLFENTAVVGEYAAMSVVAQMIQIYPQALALTLGPTVARLSSVGDIAGIQAALRSYLRLATLLAAPIFGAVAFFGPWLRFVFGSEFEFRTELSVALGLSYYVSAVLGALGYSLSMTGRHRLELTVLIAGTLGAAAICFLLVPIIGAVGAALGVTTGYVVINVARGLAAGSILGRFPGTWSELVPPIACLVAAALCRSLGDRALGGNIFGAIVAGGLYSGLVALIYYKVILRADEKSRVQGWIGGYRHQFRSR